jgi:hypothetical protein
MNWVATTTFFPCKTIQSFYIINMGIQFCQNQEVSIKEMVVTQPIKHAKGIEQA